MNLCMTTSDGHSFIAVHASVILSIGTTLLRSLGFVPSVDNAPSLHQGCFQNLCPGYLMLRSSISLIKLHALASGNIDRPASTDFS